MTMDCQDRKIGRCQLSIAGCYVLLVDLLDVKCYLFIRWMLSVTC